ncbi:hypothetical protein JCM30760_22080 [Thiomicrorhabdus hydrogeniphila]
MNTRLLSLDDGFKGGLFWFVSSLFAVSILAVSPLFSNWFWGFLAVLLVWFVLGQKYTQLQRFNVWVMIATLLSYVAAIFLLENSWLSAQSISGFLVLVIFLKLIEIRKKTEALWIIASLMVLIGIGTLYWNSIASFGFLSLIMFGVTLSMVFLIQVGKLRWKQNLLLSSKLFLLSLPLTIIFFFLVPRYEGPLWDLGLAFGVPITLTQSAPPEPLIEGNRLRSDKYSSFLKQANTVLVAEFSGKTPYKSDLYWRGPVFTHFDGLEWFLEDGSLTRSALMKGKYTSKKQWAKDVQYQGKPQKYHVKVMPHGQRWLYALESSAAGAPETFLSRDLQLLSIRNIHQEFNYDSQWLKHYRVKPQITQDERNESLAFPENTNPGLKAFGEDLAKQYPDAEKRILSLYKLFSRSFSKSERKDAVVPNYLDDVWLNKKGGSVLDIASATVMVLRASGIPTRLVTGFRGGNIVALTDFVIVKQSHAHIWLEAWLDDKGWVRVEPQDYINVQSLKDRQSSLVNITGQEKKSKVKHNTESSAKKQSKDTGTQEGNNSSHIQTHSNAVQKEGSSEDSWLNFFDKWLVDYDADKQENLLKKVGTDSGFSGGKLVIIVIGGVLVVVSLYLLVLGFLGRAKKDGIAQEYAKLQKSLSTIIVSQENECPSAYLERLKHADSAIFEIVNPLINKYLEYKYGSGEIDKKTLKKQFERVLGLLS